MDYSEMRQLFLSDLATRRHMVLATSEGGHVTARSMSVVVREDRIWFQTDARMEKARQMEANPCVALAVDGYQLEGRARLAGRWSELPAVLEDYLRFHRSSYLTYSVLDTERVYEVRLTKIKKWEYAGGQPVEKVLDLGAGTALVRSVPLS